MKNKIYEAVLNVRDKCDKKVIACSLGIGSAVGTALPVFASDSAGTSALSTSVKSAISSGAQDLLATVVDVIGITIPVTITAVGICVGAKFAIKQLKGAISKAS